MFTREVIDEKKMFTKASRNVNIKFNEGEKKMRGVSNLLLFIHTSLKIHDKITEKKIDPHGAFKFKV